MRPRAASYARFRCKHCGGDAPTKNGVIHHYRYPAGVYQRNVEELLSEGVVAWLCNSCHDKIHYAETFEESQKALTRGGKCKYCGKTMFGGWERGRILGTNDCLCRKCFRNFQRTKDEAKSGQMTLF
jgi:hypothetical protein